MLARCLAKASTCCAWHPYFSKRDSQTANIRSIEEDVRMGSPRIDPQWQGLWPRSQHLKRWCKVKQGDAKFEAGGGDNGHHSCKSSNELKLFLCV